MKFHILDQHCEDLENFGTVTLLEASSYNHSNVVPNRAYWRTSTASASRMKETFCALQLVVEGLLAKERN